MQQRQEPAAEGGDSGGEELGREGPQGPGPSTRRPDPQTGRAGIDLPSANVSKWTGRLIEHPLAPSPPRGADSPAKRPCRGCRRVLRHAGGGLPRHAEPVAGLDPALGLVVLEFRDRTGRTATLPTEREWPPTHRPRPAGPDAATSAGGGSAGRDSKGRDSAGRDREGRGTKAGTPAGPASGKGQRAELSAQRGIRRRP